LDFTNGFDPGGAIDIDIGSADITDVTFTTDGTGTAEIVLPAGSIDGTEILDDTVDSADYAAGSVDREHLSADAQGVFTEKLAASHTLSLDATTGEGYGSVVYVTAASVVLTLPAVATGAQYTIISNTANIVTVDANASDLIILDGTALDDGDSIDSPAAAGDIVTLTYYDATGWFASSNTWVDGGP